VEICPLPALLESIVYLPMNRLRYFQVPCSRPRGRSAMESPAVINPASSAVYFPCVSPHSHIQKCVPSPSLSQDRAENFRACLLSIFPDQLTRVVNDASPPSPSPPPDADVVEVTLPLLSLPPEGGPKYQGQQEGEYQSSLAHTRKFRGNMESGG
jgi:hypothetical protein